MTKFVTVVKASVTYFFAFAVTFLLFANTALAGDFSKTCEDISLRGSYLEAMCQEADGQTLALTYIDLDDYIGNIDGTLEWGDRNFSQTCDFIGLSQSLRDRNYILNAECRRRDQSISNTELNLDERLANIDGMLAVEGYEVSSEIPNAGNFSQTCQEISVRGSELIAKCERADGNTLKETSIDLDEYVENIDGYLKWQYGNFSQTCRVLNDPFDGHYLPAACKRRDQSLAFSEIDLDEHIANIDGTLEYQE